MTADPYGLSRFVEAQEGVYERALQELRRGRKATHWMWLVFPQLAGLGHSEMARRYGISSMDEAQAYLGHPVLGLRLQECTGAACGAEGRSAYEIFGSPDDLKFRSSMTLFLRAGAGEACFREALDRFFGGEEDPLTLSLLGVAGGD